MFLPPTMLPHDLRVLVDPPVQFPNVLDTPPAAGLVFTRAASPVEPLADATRAERAGIDPRTPGPLRRLI